MFAVHHMLYMFGAIDNSTAGGCAARGQYWIRKAMTELYRPDAQMFCGDEDNGEVASWLILSALGLYSLSPATPNYQLGSPLFAQVRVHLDNETTLDIVAPGNSASSVFVGGVSWNGNSISGTAVSYFDLRKGGTLQFNVTDSAPSGWMPPTAAKTSHLRQGRKTRSQRNLQA
jgi:putative alpha-1,2-mannosidase